MTQMASIRRAVTAIAPLVALLVSIVSADAHHITTNDENSQLVFTHGTTATAVEWKVDGRRILVYISSPANQFVINHDHTGAHVGTGIHFDGTLFGSPGSFIEDEINRTTGIVYRLDGGPPGSGTSRLQETVHLQVTPTASGIAFTGLGFEPFPHGGTPFERPDLTGLELTGTSRLMLYHIRGGISGPAEVLASVSFSGFNSLRSIPITVPSSIPANEQRFVLLVTELNVRLLPPEDDGGKVK